MSSIQTKLFKKYESGKTSIRTNYENMILEVAICEKMEQHILKLEAFVLHKEYLVWIKRNEKEQYESYLNTCHKMQIVPCVNSVEEFIKKQKLQRIFIDINGNISLSLKDETGVYMGWGIQCFPVSIKETKI